VQRNHFENDIIVITEPISIRFPRWTKPIQKLSCGSAHVLALSVDGSLYSWGSGAYGSLGFGSREDIIFPAKL